MSVLISHECFGAL